MEEERDFLQLEEATKRVTQGVRSYESVIEEYASFSDIDITHRPTHIRDMSIHTHRLDTGIVQNQVVLMDVERFGQHSGGSVDAGETQSLSNDMAVYAERLESGMNEKIQELAEIGASVASLSHCVKNIVNNLKAGSFIMEKGIKNENYGQMKKGWTMLGKNINRMSDLAMDMLTYSKKRKPDYEDYELNKILEEVADFNLEKARSRNVRVVKELDPDVGLIYLEHKGIYRCVLNLVSNSIDACEGKEDCTVWVRSRLLADEGMVRIDITDNGIGMTEETKQKLFTSFFSTKGSKGTGLGLPTTYKIIQEHEGTIDVQSEYGKGTTFSITLPTEHKMKPN